MIVLAPSTASVDVVLAEGALLRLLRDFDLAAFFLVAMRASPGALTLIAPP
jgi:hypothetical protein